MKFIYYVLIVVSVYCCVVDVYCVDLENYVFDLVWEEELWKVV